MLYRKEIERQMNLTFFFQSQNKINCKLKHQEATRGGEKKKPPSKRGMRMRIEEHTL